MVLCIAFAMVLFAASCTKWRSGYLNFTNHDKGYYSRIAAGCDMLLSRTNRTSDWWILNGDDGSLPVALRNLNSTIIKVAKLQPMGKPMETNSFSAVIIVFGEGRPDFVVSWEQNDYGNGHRPWELSAVADGESAVVFTTTNLSLLNTNSAN
jgi:hypothetical protein